MSNNKVNFETSVTDNPFSFANNMKIPDPPKKGELIKCQICGEPIYPEQFSKNMTLRKMQFKWQIHDSCYNLMLDVADRSLPGLIQERKKQGLIK